MSDSLWADIDGYYATNLLADLGPGNSKGYSDLLVPDANSILVGYVMDPDHVTKPALLINGFDVEHPLDGPHSDGTIHIDDITYPYELVGLVEHETLATAKDNGQEMFRRLREFMRDHYALGGLTSDDGEFVSETRIGQGRVAVRGKSGTNTGKYLAYAVLTVDVISNI